MGRPKGYKRSQESIDKMVATRKRRGNYCHTDETKKIISITGIGRIPWNKNKKSPQTSGEKNGRWIGGGYIYLHNLAWKKFGKDYCEECGINLIDYYKENNRRFDMHCMSNPKDYTIMEQSNWMCLCKNDHGKIDQEVNEQ